MKMSRGQFKEIVKECLIEILSEGMGSPSSIKESIFRHEVSSKNLSSVRQDQSSLRRRPQDTVSYGQKQNHPVLDRKVINEVIKNEAGGDAVLASILADTASTTLPNMLMNEGRNQPPAPAGSIERVVAAANPQELFGDEAASKWAALAFMDTPKKF
jgi:hypothetical protein